MRRTIIVVTTAFGALALAGCGPTGQSGPTYTRGQIQTHMVSAINAYDQCARQHGLPNLPDPQMDDLGNLTYPPGSIPASGFPQSVLDGCAGAWGTFHHWRDLLDQTRPTPRPHTAAEINQARQWAACLRTHGFPDFPDPGPDGSFTNVPPGFDKVNPSAAAQAAMAACNK